MNGYAEVFLLYYPGDACHMLAYGDSRIWRIALGLRVNLRPESPKPGLVVIDIEGGPSVLVGSRPFRDGDTDSGFNEARFHSPQKSDHQSRKQCLCVRHLQPSISVDRKLISDTPGYSPCK